MVLSMERWVGKAALVTGASAGIGAAIAEKLVEEGMQVVAVARSIDKLRALAEKLEHKSGKLHPVQADVSKEEDILRAFEYVSENLGPLHVLVNNAGIHKPGTIADGKTEDWMDVLKVNLLAVSIATREAVKDMMANNVDGHIIHINSVTGHSVPPYAGLSLYPSTKHAITGLTETHRIDLRHLGTRIKVTSLSPGVVETSLNHSTGDLLDGVSKLKTEDIADAVVYVLSTPVHVQIHELIIKPLGEVF